MPPRPRVVEMVPDDRQPRVSAGFKAAPGDQVGAEALGRRVAESLRSLRKEQRLSLDQLAVASGVSRAALSQIEGYRTNPRLSLLWKIAVGLGVPFHALLGEVGSKPRVLRAGDVPPMRSSDGKMESRLLSPVGENQSLEVYELRFRQGGVHQSEAHGARTSETVVLLTGALRVRVGVEIHDLAPGDSIFFRSDVPHAYESQGSHETCCLDVISYRRS
jgi:transcriptional regulator with XRE-family HTH domain